MVIPNVIGSVPSFQSKKINNNGPLYTRNDNVLVEDKLIPADKLDGVLDDLSKDLNDSIDNIFNLGSNVGVTLPSYLQSEDYIEDFVSNSEPTPNINRVVKPSENVNTEVTVPREEPFDDINTNHRDEILDVNRHDTIDDSSSSSIGVTDTTSTHYGSEENFNNNVSSTDELAQLIRSSSAYQNAYKVFSSDKKYGESFLIRLESIPDSIMSSNGTIWDDLGLSNNAEDIKRSAYNDALISIQNLLAEYYQYINSLPTTQVQQFWDAGINSAITGQGINGSTLSATPQNNNSGVLSSTNSGSYIASLANLLLNTIPSSISSLSNAFSALKNARSSLINADTAERKALADLWNHLNEMGYSLEGVSFDSWDDVTTWQENLQFDTKTQSKEFQKYIENFFLDIKKTALMSQRGEDNLTDSLGVNIEEFYNDLGNHLIEQYVYEQKFNAVKAQYDYDYTKALSASDASNFTNYTNKFGYANHKFQMGLIEDRLKFINKWKNKISKSNDPVAKSSFVEFLMGVNDTYLGRVGGVIRTVGSIMP